MSNKHVMKFKGKTFTFTDDDIIKWSVGIELTSNNIVEECVLLALTDNWLDDIEHSQLAHTPRKELDDFFEFGMTALIKKIFKKEKTTV